KIIISWSFGIHIWGSIKLSNILLIQEFQNISLHTITVPCWFITSQALHNNHTNSN
ncbi:ribosome biogenesis protein TSR3 isoform X1, partial [Aphis craccivora]